MDMFHLQRYVANRLTVGFCPVATGTPFPATIICVFCTHEMRSGKGMPAFSLNARTSNGASQVVFIWGQVDACGREPTMP